MWALWIHTKYNTNLKSLFVNKPCFIRILGVPEKIQHEGKSTEFVTSCQTFFNCSEEIHLMIWKLGPLHNQKQEITYVAAMTTSSVVTGCVRERSWTRRSLRSTAALRDRGLGTPPSEVFSSSCKTRGKKKKKKVWLISKITDTFMLNILCMCFFNH